MLFYALKKLNKQTNMIVLKSFCLSTQTQKRQKTFKALVLFRGFLMGQSAEILKILQRKISCLFLRLNLKEKPMSHTDKKPPEAAHHFKSLSHQISAEKLGMWLFLATEVLMFGGLFVGYLIYRGEYPQVFKAGAGFLDWKKGAINTVILLVSSFTMALSVYFAQKDKMRQCRLMLSATLLCGLSFILIKYLEYSHKFHDGIFPGKFFSYTGEGFVEGLPLYFSFYYLMTGLHASHVFIGLALILWALIKALKNQIGPQNYTPLEYVGLFWHLVDLIWIYLFPLLYLIN